MIASRLAIVSYLGRDPLTPRGTRTQALVKALSSDWEIELHSSSTALRAAPDRSAAMRHTRKALRMIRERILFDNQEGWSRFHFRAWTPEVDGALLIGWPMSPLVYASVHLCAHQIPYVVDIGDPWVLTHPDSTARYPVAARAARAERRLWAGARGAVVTTTAQAEAISRLYPTMPILVRPNGYEPTKSAAKVIPADRPDQSLETLSLVHFGDLSSLRVDVGVLLKRLVNSGRWREVRFAQYGSDWDGALERAPSESTITMHRPVPWEEAISVVRAHDAAIVIGNWNHYQMPSKAVQYLTLPIPRVALTSGRVDDALMQYVADRPGWLTVGIDDPRLAERICNHMAHRWSTTDLTPPLDEAWPRVATEIATFASGLLTGRRSFPPSSRNDANSVLSTYGLNH